MAGRRRTRRSPRTPRTRPVKLTWSSLLLILGLLALGWLAERQGWLTDPDVTPTPFVAGDGDGGGTVGVFVEPDDGRSPVLAEIEAARTTITLQVYLLSDEEIIAALERATARGVEVRVLLEEHPFGGSGLNPRAFERLTAAGVAVRWSNPVFRFSHVKTLVVDRAVALIMNLNLTRAAFTDNREFGVITTRPAEVAQAVAIFEADWARTAEPPEGPLVVSPVNSRQRLLELIEGATRTIDLYAEVVADEEIVAALVAAEERGVAVRLLMSPEESAEDDRGVAERAALVEAGVEVRLLRRPYIHAKIVLVDLVRVYVGSQNFTATSLDQNREIGIVIDEPAGVARIARIFEEDFAAATPV